MASGTPDYFRTVRQVYGAGKKATGDVTALANAKKSVLTVSGKGMIYGGVIVVDYTSDQSDSIPILALDGIEVGLTAFASLNVFNMTHENCYPFYLLQFDEINFRYTVGISRGFTFDSSFEVLYDEKHGTTPLVSCLAVYALMG